MLPTDYNDGLIQDFAFVEQPTRTYRLHFNGRPSYGMLHGVEAMKQAVFLILHTERFRYEIFSWNYGTELHGLFGQNITAILQAKLQRAIEDALLADDRILQVDDFVFTKSGKRLTVQFTVYTTQGEFSSEYEFEGGMFV